MSLRRPVTAVTLGFGIALTLAGHASAHANGSSADCNGVHALAQYYELDDTNHITVTVGGNVVADVADFGTDYDQTFPVPQGGASTTWSVVIDSSDDAWDSTNSGTVGPCGEIETTTTTELVTTTTEQETTTSEATTTTSTPTTTTSAETTTIPLSTTTVPDTTTTTTQPVGTLPTTSSLPSTSAPSSTSTSTSLPASTTSSSSTSAPPFSTTTPPTTPECSDNPNTPQSDCTPILPPTGFAGAVIGGIAGCLIGVGLLIGLVLRRKS